MIIQICQKIQNHTSSRMREQTLPRYLQLIKSFQFEISNYLSMNQHKYVHFSSTMIS